MYEGNWTCSKCGGAITQLPFEPRSNSGLTCRTCYAKGKDAEKAEVASVPDPANSAGPMTDGPGFEGTQLADEPPLEDAFAGMDSLAASAPGDNQTDAGAPAAKPKIEGNWTCAGCGAAITSLPFTPRSTNNLKCLDCFKASK